MNSLKRTAKLALVGALLASVGIASFSYGRASRQDDRASIERLHQLDVQATLSGKADELAKLWDGEAVRLQEGSPAEVGRAAIYADDKRWEASASRGQPLSYNSDIKDLQTA